MFNNISLTKVVDDKLSFNVGTQIDHFKTFSPVKNLGQD